MPAARELAREIADNASAISNTVLRHMMWRMLGASHPIEAHRIDTLGIDVDHQFMGRPIFSLIGSDEERPIFSEQQRGCCGRTRYQETALIMGNYKLIKRLGTNNVHLLFDMHEDPMERGNVIDSAPNAAELIDKMDSLVQANASMYGGIEAEKTTLDEETTQQLKALGYIQ